MKHPLTATVALFALSACGPPVGDPSHEIIETSKGAIGRLVTLKTTPSLKSGSVTDAAREWRATGWEKVASQRCKDVVLPAEQAVEAYEIVIDGSAPEKIPTRRLRLCATQLSEPKAIAAIGFIVSSEAAQPIKP